jgi:hypothetical protein
MRWYKEEHRSRSKIMTPQSSHTARPGIGRRYAGRGALHLQVEEIMEFADHGPGFEWIDLRLNGKTRRYRKGAKLPEAKRGEQHVFCAPDGVAILSHGCKLKEFPRTISVKIADGGERTIQAPPAAQWVVGSSVYAYEDRKTRTRESSLPPGFYPLPPFISQLFL